MWRGIGFIRQCKLMLTRFVRLRGLPEEIARGMALGFFIGMTPTMGLQMPIALLWFGGILLAPIAYWLTLRLVPSCKVWRPRHWPRRHWHRKSLRHGVRTSPTMIPTGNRNCSGSSHDCNPLSLAP